MLLRFFYKRVPLKNFSCILQPFSLLNPSKVRAFSEGGAHVVDDDGDDEPRDSLCSRVERLGRGESIVSAFQSWMGQGFAIHRGDIFHAINRLRKLKKNKRALEVSKTITHYLFDRMTKRKRRKKSILWEFDCNFGFFLFTFALKKNRFCAVNFFLY